MILWSLWNDRNSLVRSMKSRAVGEILDRAVDHLQEYQNNVASMCPVSTKIMSSGKVTWVPPPVGNFKLNIDAVVKTGLSYMGACAVIKDSERKVNTTSSKALIGIFSPELGECLALREGLLLAKQFDLKESWVEVDVVNVIACVNSVNNLLSPARLIVNDIKALCKDVDIVSSQAISRGGNGMAHTLALLLYPQKRIIFGLV